MYNIIEEIIKEAYNEEVIIDNDKFNIAFNTKINDKEFIKNLRYPTLEIKDMNQFVGKMAEYIKVFLENISTKLPTFVTNKEINLIKVLVTYVFCNATTEEFKDPIKLIQSKIDYLQDKTFNDLNETYDGFIEGTKINVKNAKQTLYMETPNKIEVTMTKDENIYHFPSITYGISNNECYIYAIQNKNKTDDPFSKKVNRQLYKLNKNVEQDLLEITPNAIVSLTIFLDLLKKNNIEKVHAVPYLPVRFYSREIALEKIEESKKEILKSRNNLIKKNATEKFIRIFNRTNLHTDILNIDSLPFEKDDFLNATLKEPEITNDILKNVVTNISSKVM